ncbi:MAG: hypothetical protein ACXWPK_05115 [Isosphaeraceae bacterium]
MKYRIELAATAKADIRGQAQWLREQVSLAAADEWLAGLYKTSPREFDRQGTSPAACPAVHDLQIPLNSAT